jgi:hypothetical protein
VRGDVDLLCYLSTSCLFFKNPFLKKNILNFDVHSRCGFRAISVTVISTKILLGLLMCRWMEVIHSLNKEEE